MSVNGILRFSFVTFVAVTVDLLFERVLESSSQLNQGSHGS